MGEYIQKRELTYEELEDRLGRKDYEFPNNYGDEGEDHINIANGSKLFSGRFLNLTYTADVDYPVIGKFSSINNMITWLKSGTGDNALRKMPYKKLRAHPQYKVNKFIPNFSAIAILATLSKIAKRPQVYEEIMALPRGISVLSYHTCEEDRRLRLCNTVAHRIVPIITEVIRSMHEGREPHWHEFLDVAGTVKNGFLETVVGFVAFENGRWDTCLSFNYKREGQEDTDTYEKADKKSIYPWQEYCTTYDTPEKMIEKWTEAVSDTIRNEDMKVRQQWRIVPLL